jgi:hypothetical protein
MTHSHPCGRRHQGRWPLRHLSRWGHRLFRSHRYLDRSEHCRMLPSFPRHKRRRSLALVLRLASAPTHRSDQAISLVGSVTLQLALKLATSP